MSNFCSLHVTSIMYELLLGYTAQILLNFEMSLGYRPTSTKIIVCSRYAFLKPFEN